MAKYISKYFFLAIVLAAIIKILTPTDLLTGLFSKNLFLNLLVIGAAYFFLRLYKKGKPPHWTASVFLFLFKTRYYGQKREHPKELEHDGL